MRSLLTICCAAAALLLGSTEGYAYDSDRKACKRALLCCTWLNTNNWSAGMYGEVELVKKLGFSPNDCRRLLGVSVSRAEKKAEEETDRLLAAEDLTTEQLHRLFSGSVVHASGGDCGGIAGKGTVSGTAVWNFDLKEDGRLEVRITCPSGTLNAPDERSSGKWRIEANTLCMEDLDGYLTVFRSINRCWRVKPGTSFFDVYDSDFRKVHYFTGFNSKKVWEFTVFNSKLPKGLKRQVAALDTLSGKATTESGTAAQKEIARLKREAGEARKEIAATRARTAELTRLKREAERAREAKRRAEVERKAKEEAQRVAEAKRRAEEERKAKAEKKLASKPPSTSSQTATNTFPTAPIDVHFNTSKTHPNDIAVIIANADYKKLGRDIPNVTPAYADAAGIRQYFMKAKGVREGNIIHIKDATGSQIISVFGSERNHKGRLFNWVKPNVSKVYIYYAGHGAPAGDEGSAYLIPSDATSETVDLTGYPLATLYKNLGKIPAKSVTVILEACFSGTSQTGSLIPRSSGITIVPKVPLVPTNVTVISAGAANQIASWEKDEKHSLFTKYFLKSMSGEGDKKPYGNGDGKVTYKELGKYLEGTMTYFARRYYGRDQKAQIVSGG